MTNKSTKRNAQPDKSPEGEYERFLETAETVGASKDAKDLDKAVKKVARVAKAKTP